MKTTGQSPSEEIEEKNKEDVTMSTTSEVKKNNLAAENTISIIIKWSGHEYPLKLTSDTSILQLKTLLYTLTGVQPHRMKLLGVSIKGKPPADETLLSQLGLKPNQKIMAVGTPESEVPDIPPEDHPEVFNDFDFDYYMEPDEMRNVEENRKNLKIYTQKTQINIINPPRPGKKLLVLDLDHTLLDFDSKSSNLAEQKRPYLDEFMIAMYQEYDIVIWSQTSWKWVEIKLTELGLITHPGFKIMFVMDKTSMFTVTSKKRQSDYKHEVKALEIIWSKFPQYSPKNTIHIDDLSRNFAMNPKNGLKIKNFKTSPETRQTDQELYFLTKYLLKVASAEDLSALDHSKWKSTLND